MDDPKYVAIIRVPVYADSEAQARERIDPYVRNMQVESEVEIRPFKDPPVIDIDGGTVRIKLKDPEQFTDRRRLALIKDYDFEIIDRHGVSHGIPDLVSELTISFKGEEYIPQVRLTVDRV